MVFRTTKSPFILLVNPWITDFAAYDYWAKPLGLLFLASLLKEGGCGVTFVDCLDRHDSFTNQHPDVFPGVHRRFGTGKYPRMLIPKPEALSEIPRNYYRYGIHPEALKAKLRLMERPDLIWVTSMMTYWYPGVQQTVSILREIFPKVPVWLGGIYARLCSDHARKESGADEIVVSPTGDLPKKLEAVTGFVVRNQDHWSRFDLWPEPALELIRHSAYAPLLFTMGCPFKCPYCASPLLHPTSERRNYQVLYKEIMRWHERLGVVDFAWYDDALLIGARNTLRPVLERIAAQRLPIRFHTPNALHIRALTTDWCNVLYESGFSTIRLGLETTDSRKQREWGGKVKTEMFLSAVERLLNAGFSSSQIGAYLLCGLPGQSPQDVAESIKTVETAGVNPYIAEYSPIPGTAMWTEALRVSPFDLAAEPLYHNNSFFACRRPDFSYEDLQDLKQQARQVRHNRSMQPEKPASL